MIALADTHILLWAIVEPAKLTASTRALLEDPSHVLYFSPASIWEVVVKRIKGHADFQVDPAAFRRQLLQNGFLELPITSEHTLAVQSLPAIHKDPFDRILVGQALAESLTLITRDAKVLRYPGNLLGV